VPWLLAYGARPDKSLLVALFFDSFPTFARLLLALVQIRPQSGVQTLLLDDFGAWLRLGLGAITHEKGHPCGWGKPKHLGPRQKTRQGRLRFRKPCGMFRALYRF